MMIRCIEINQFAEGVTVIAAIIVVVADATVVRNINVNAIVFDVVFETTPSRISLLSCDCV